MARKMTRPLGGKMGEGMGMPRRLTAAVSTEIDRTEEFAAKWANPSILATTTVTGQTGFDGVDLFWRDENQRLYFFGTNGNGTYVCDLTWNGSGWTEGTWYQISSVEKQHERITGCMVTDTIGFVVVTESASWNNPVMTAFAFEKGAQASTGYTQTAFRGHPNHIIPLYLPDGDYRAVVQHQRTDVTNTDTRFCGATLHYDDGTNTLTRPYSSQRNAGYSGAYYANGYMPRSGFTYREGWSEKGHDTIVAHFGSSTNTAIGFPASAIAMIQPNSTTTGQIQNYPLRDLLAGAMDGNESNAPIAWCRDGVMCFPQQTASAIWRSHETLVRMDQTSFPYTALAQGDRLPWEAVAIPDSNIGIVIFADTLNTKTKMSVLRGHQPQYYDGDDVELETIKEDFEIDASIAVSDSGRLLNWGDRLIWGAHDKIYVIEA